MIYFLRVKENRESHGKGKNAMSEQITKKDFQDFTGTILEALNDMYANLSTMVDEKISRSENSIKTAIENGVEKQAKLNGEGLGALTEKVEAIEEHLGKLTQEAEQLKLDILSIRSTLEEHNNDLFILRKAK